MLHAVVLCSKFFSRPSLSTCPDTLAELDVTAPGKWAALNSRKPSLNRHAAKEGIPLHLRNKVLVQTYFLEMGGKGSKCWISYLHHFFIRKKKSASGRNVYFNGILVSLVNEFNIQKGSQKTRERIKVEVNYSVCFWKSHGPPWLTASVVDESPE